MRQHARKEVAISLAIQAILDGKLRPSTRDHLLDGRMQNMMTYEPQVVLKAMTPGGVWVRLTSTSAWSLRRGKQWSGRCVSNLDIMGRPTCTPGGRTRWDLEEEAPSGWSPTGPGQDQPSTRKKDLSLRPSATWDEDHGWSRWQRSWRSGLTRPLAGGALSPWPCALRQLPVRSPP